MKSKMLSVPYIVWSAVFVVVPLALIVFFSFTNEDGSFTFQNFIDLYNLDGAVQTMLLSFKLALISTVICLILAFPVAYIMSRLGSIKRRTLLMLVMIPMWMNFLLRTYSWMTLLEDTGLINKFLALFGIGPLHMINTEGAIIVGMIYNYLPFMILPLYSVMDKIDNSLIEASQDLGANMWKVVCKVLIPLSLPGIITGITMVFVPSVSTFVISRMLGGGTMLIGDLIENRFIGGVYDPYLGSAMAIVLMVIILIIMGIINMFDNEEMEGIIV